MPGNDVTLTANFEPDAPVVPDQFTVTINGGDGATGAGQYKAGEKVTVTDSTKPTVTFDMPSNNVTLTANFEPDAPVVPDQFTVTVNGGDGATGAGQYKEGDKVTVTAGTKAGYTFTNWSASGVILSNPTSSTITFDMPKNAVTLTANWTVYNPGGGSGSGSGGGSSSSNDRDDSPVSNSTVQKNPDGSTTTTVKKPNGSTTVTTTWKDGSKEVIQTQKDGTSTTTVSRTDGTTATTVNQSGRTEVETTLSQSAVDAARKESAPLPISPLTPNSNPSKAPLVTVRLPEGSGTVKVEIPTKNLTMGTVAVLVQPDGTEHVLKTALPVENGMVVSLRDGEMVKLVDKSRTYADVPTNYWGSDGIQFTSSRKLFTGTSASTFSPDTLMDRAMFWTVLARYDGVNTDGGPTWYQMGQVWAVNRGISDGAAPNNPITREQLVTMLYRYAQSAGQDVSARGSLSRYQDQGQVSSFAEEAMSWATAEGLLSGTSTNTLSPGGLATRAEVAALLTRYCIWAA